ncbi:uncharacterized protein PV09_04231 [Verruconis gallopava]|uniref:Histone deacetylase complex subunit SAP18 n=1 Tax=Verruconis gallopava TaxID=253628 RepID=A0A0D2ADM7_9PEZI|nr:uncharacterized protein PV09_04231 [Verruconis gallopava]KIW05083.1 hypothetical protein PV09_04231 [Verruconis gallopava]
MDRNAVAPFLVKLFYKEGGHNRVDAFHPIEPTPPYIEIYTWLTTTLDELAHEVTERLKRILPDPVIGTRLDFELVFPDMRSQPRGDGYGSYQKKPLGSVIVGAGGPGVPVGDGAVQRGSYVASDESKTLADAKFVIGDYIDCAFYPPLANGDIAIPQRGVMGRHGPPRENGYWSVSMGSRRGGRSIGSGLPAGEWRRGDPVPSTGGGPSRRNFYGRDW